MKFNLQSKQDGSTITSIRATNADDAITMFALRKNLTAKSLLSLFNVVADEKEKKAAEEAGDRPTV